jgi:glycosyltransferase involved in cell wall biosynthesis
MRNIAIFTGVDIRTFGGGERYAIELANRLKDSNVTIFSNIEKNNRVTTEEIEKMLHNNVKLKFYNTIKLPILKICPLTYSFLKSILDIKNFDVVYNMDQYFPITNINVLFACRLFNKRYVLGIHNPDFFADKPNNPSLAKNIVFPIYNFFRRIIVSMIPNIHVINKDDKLTLLNWRYKHNIFYVPHFSYNEIKEEHIKNNNKKFIALFVGRLYVRHKGLDLLAKIIDYVLTRNNKIIFHVIGSGEDGESLIKNLLTKYPKNIVWQGFIQDNELTKAYSESSIFVMPSRVESFGLSLLEAQSNGLPVVAFDIKGPKDIINTSIQGTLIQPFDVTKFSEAILTNYKLWKENSKYLKIKRRITKIIKDKFGYSVLEDKITKMIYAGKNE